ncbi:MAG TPA: hypothetical protein VHL34_12885 [Rhizomicrobium sp.]|nr:hypothetical protein [Rhizomicrobium sp.]
MADLDIGVSVPHAPFGSFVKVFAHFRERGLTSHIEVLDIAGIPSRAAAHLVEILKWFGLLTPENQSTVPLQQLVDGFGTTAFNQLLLDMLSRCYGLTHDDGTPPSADAVQSAIHRLAPGISRDVERRAVQFCLHAFRYACTAPPEIFHAATPENGQSGPDAALTLLISKFPTFDPTWPNDVKVKWFAGFDRLMKSVDQIGRHAHGELHVHGPADTPDSVDCSRA